MSRKRLTTRFIDSIKPPKDGRAEYWDEGVPGFGLRVTPAGRRSWVLMYRSARGQRRWTFGTYPALPLAAARDRAKEALQVVAKGGDPAGQKASDRRAPTVKDLVEEYIERWAKKRKKTWKKDQQVLERELLPRFGSRKAISLERGELRPVFEEIAERAPVAANRFLEIVRRVWNWALEVDYPTIQSNPWQGIRKVQERGGERWLRPSEIAAVWRAMDKLPPKWRAFCKLSLLTGQHPGEILTMGIDQVERLPEPDGGAWWVMPEGHHKAAWAHSVYLAPAALEAFDDACRLLAKDDGQQGSEDAGAEEQPEHVFPARHGGASNPDNAPWKKPVADLVSYSKVDWFTARDFRPTVATGMESEPLHIPQVVVAKVLGHANTSITAQYTRHGYDSEKRQAMLRWAARVDELANCSADAGKVVTLSRSGK